jgi:hypothetical protein
MRTACSRPMLHQGRGRVNATAGGWRTRRLGKALAIVAAATKGSAS